MIRPCLLEWQGRDYSAKHRDRINLLLHIVAVPLFQIATIVLVVAVVTGAGYAAGLGCLGIGAAVVIQARVTSAWKARASPPPASIISTVRFASATSRSTTTTRVPARERRIAEARPLPMPSPAAPPPVTTATLPAKPSCPAPRNGSARCPCRPRPGLELSALRVGFYHRRRTVGAEGANDVGGRVV